MIYEIKQKNKVPDVLIGAFLFCGIVCAAFSNFDIIKGRGILQIITLIFFCAMIYVLVKFKFTKLRIIIRKKEQVKGDNGNIVSYPPNQLEMAIDTAQGTRGYVTECLVALEDIIEFVQVPMGKDEKKKLYSKYTKNPKYKYKRNIVGAETWLMEVRTSQGISVIEVEACEELANYLSAVTRFNKESIHNDDNEENE